MIDIKLIRETPDAVKQSLLKKGADYSTEIDRIIVLDSQRRALITEAETDKSEQNKVSKQIPQIKKDGGDAAPIIERLNALKDKIWKADFVRSDAENIVREINRPQQRDSRSKGMER